MKDEKILKKAIKRAIKNGWDTFQGSKFKDAHILDVFLFKNMQMTIAFKGGGAVCPDVITVIFSHDFAKAFFGNETILAISSSTNGTRRRSN